MFLLILHFLTVTKDQIKNAQSLKAAVEQLYSILTRCIIEGPPVKKTYNLMLFRRFRVRIEFLLVLVLYDEPSFYKQIDDVSTVVVPNFPDTTEFNERIDQIVSISYN